MTAAATRRIARGRGHSYLLDGQSCPGVTTILSGGLPKPALVPWATRLCAEYVADHWDDLAAASPSERITLVKGAPNASRDAAAVRGQDVHTLAERVLLGEAVDVPEHLAGYVDQCVDFLDTWNAQPILSEAVVLNRRYSYMGTLDLVATLADGRTWLLDWKTAKGVYADNALQLAAYRFAGLYLGPDGEELELPDIDACGVVHLRHDGWDLVPADAGETTFRSFLYVLGVYRFACKGGVGESVLGEPLARPTAREATST